MTVLLDTLLAEATSLDEYEVLLDMFGEIEPSEWVGNRPNTRKDRREHFAQRVLKAEAVIESWGWGRFEAKKKAPLFADNLKKCSCWMCRSPRTLYRGKNSERYTKQELDSLACFKQQLTELAQGE